MATKLWAIALILFCTLLTSSGQVFYKFAANRLSFDLGSLITNYYLIIGLAFYFISAILLIIAMKGGEVSVLYPLFATSYIWVSLASVYFFGESIGALKWSGIAMIIIGVSLIGIGSNSG